MIPPEDDDWLADLLARDPIAQDIYNTWLDYQRGPGGPTPPDPEDTQ